MSKLIKKVAESQVLSDKNGRNYKTIAFETENQVTIKHPVLGELTAYQTGQTSKMVCYEKNYLNDTMDLGYSEPIGAYFLGDIVTKSVTPYNIKVSEEEVKTVSTYTTIVFGDTTSDKFNSTVKSVFKAKGFDLEYIESAKQIIAAPIASNEISKEVIEESIF